MCPPHTALLPSSPLGSNCQSVAPVTREEEGWVKVRAAVNVDAWRCCSVRCLLHAPAPLCNIVISEMKRSLGPFLLCCSPLGSSGRWQLSRTRSHNPTNTTYAKSTNITNASPITVCWFWWSWLMAKCYDLTFCKVGLWFDCVFAKYIRYIVHSIDCIKVE